MKRIIIFLLFCSNIAQADCPSVSYLMKNDRVQCEGFLFSPAKELEVRTKVEHYDIMADLTQKQDAMINNLNQQITVYNKELTQAKNEDQLDKILYFALGVVLTYAAGKVIK